MDQNQHDHLSVEDAWSTKAMDGLMHIFLEQRKLQESFDVDFPTMQTRLGWVMQYLDWNHHGLQDELREFFTALGGVDSHGSAVWKPWKAAHGDARHKALAALSERERHELFLEVVDMWKFLLNMTMAVGMTAQDVYNYFMAKTGENYARQQNNY